MPPQKNPRPVKVMRYYKGMFRIKGAWFMTEEDYCRAVVEDGMKPFPGDEDRIAAYRRRNPDSKQVPTKPVYIAYR
jgi:hypothetical protein